MLYFIYRINHFHPYYRLLQHFCHEIRTWKLRQISLLDVIFIVIDVFFVVALISRSTSKPSFRIAAAIDRSSLWRIGDCGSIRTSRPFLSWPRSNWFLLREKVPRSFPPSFSPVPVRRGRWEPLLSRMSRSPRKSSNFFGPYGRRGAWRMSRRTRGGNFHPPV